MYYLERHGPTNPGIGMHTIVRSTPVVPVPGYWFWWELVAPVHTHTGLSPTYNCNNNDNNDIFIIKITIINNKFHSASTLPLQNIVQGIFTIIAITVYNCVHTIALSAMESSLQFVWISVLLFYYYQKINIIIVIFID